MRMSLMLITTAIIACNSAQQSFYGEQIDETGISLVSEVKGQLSQADEVEVKLAATIETTCRMKGCWMNVKTDDGEDLRVTFKDYGFFVPKEGVDGKATTILGKLKKQITDVETLKHIAADAGKSQEEIAGIVLPKEEYTFVASGVIIKN